MTKCDGLLQMTTYKYTKVKVQKITLHQSVLFHQKVDSITVVKCFNGVAILSESPEIPTVST